MIGRHPLAVAAVVQGVMPERCENVWCLGGCGVDVSGDRHHWGREYLVTGAGSGDVLDVALYRYENRGEVDPVVVCLGVTAAGTGAQEHVVLTLAEAHELGWVLLGVFAQSPDKFAPGGELVELTPVTGRQRVRVEMSASRAVFTLTAGAVTMRARAERGSARVLGRYLLAVAAEAGFEVAR